MPLMEETQSQKKSTPPAPEEAVRKIPQEEWEAVAEALLFSAGDSIALVHIAKTLGVDPQTAQRVIEGLAAKYDEQKRGIRVIRVGRAYQMTSRPEYYPYIGQLYKSEAASSLMLSNCRMIGWWTLLSVRRSKGEPPRDTEIGGAQDGTESVFRWIKSRAYSMRCILTVFMRIVRSG